MPIPLRQGPGPNSPSIWLIFWDEILQDCLYQTNRSRCPDYAASGSYGSTPPKAQKRTL